MTESGLDEVEVMRKLAEALANLEPSEIQRVLRWANDRYGAASGGPVGEPHRASDALRSGLASAPPADLAGLFAAAAATTEAERTLVVAYWMQEVRGDPEVDAQSVNKELKHLGEGVGNITSAFTKLIGQKPQLVIQTRKEGSSQQARKKYKVTTAGKRAVQVLLAKGSEG